MINYVLYIHYSFCHYKSLYINKLRERKDLFWVIVSEVSIHHGEEGMTEQSNSHHGNQEASG
jgi:hypothetical protein